MTIEEFLSHLQQTPRKWIFFNLGGHRRLRLPVHTRLDDGRNETVLSAVYAKITGDKSLSSSPPEIVISAVVEVLKMSSTDATAIADASEGFRNDPVLRARLVTAVGLYDY